jgi:hypothetical protein
LNKPHLHVAIDGAQKMQAGCDCSNSALIEAQAFARLQLLVADIEFLKRQHALQSADN